jgi:3,4-dihydroxy 2-butanone 4-phosphate synthase / GTP cyclohydrolase II
MSYEKVKKALAEIRAGKMVILVDDEDRENEGDLVMAAELVTPEAINFMATHGRGLICVTLTEQRCQELNLHPMVQQNTATLGTAFTVSIEAKRGVTTGISAFDRARTILTTVADDTLPEDLARPGHIFPIRAKNGGVLVRTGQTEGSVDLARMAGLKPAGIVCEIMNTDGSMSRLPELEEFAALHHMTIISIADMIRYRLRQESMVKRVSTSTIAPNIGKDVGTFVAHIYQSKVDGTEHVALVKGEINPEEAILVRVHSHSILGNVFGVRRGGGRADLERAFELVAEAGRGVIVYMNSTMPMSREVSGDTRGGDMAGHQLRDFGIGAQILADLGVSQLRLLTNQPEKKIVAIEGFGLKVVETVPLITSEPVRLVKNN